jgi:hypothetical protein
MTFGARLIAIAILSLSPVLSYGQSYSQPTYPRRAGPDVAYCQTLSNMYAHYIGHDWQYGAYKRRRANNDAQVAMTQCETNTEFAIPVLERELRANNFTLPPRG